MRAFGKLLSRGVDLLKGKRPSRSRELTRRMIHIESLETRNLFNGDTSLAFGHQDDYGGLFLVDECSCSCNETCSTTPTSADPNKGGQKITDKGSPVGGMQDSLLAPHYTVQGLAQMPSFSGNTPDYIVAEIDFGDIFVDKKIYYQVDSSIFTSSSTANQWYAYTFLVNPDESLNANYTGVYDWTMTISYMDVGVTEPLAAQTIMGTKYIQDTRTSVLGTRWYETNRPRLNVAGNQVELMSGAGAINVLKEDSSNPGEYLPNPNDPYQTQLTILNPSAGVLFYLFTKNDGSSTKFDSNHRLVEETNAIGNKTTYTYSSGGLLESISYPGFQRIEYHYTNVGKIDYVLEYPRYIDSYNPGSSIKTDYQYIYQDLDNDFQADANEEALLSKIIYDATGNPSSVSFKYDIDSSDNFRNEAGNVVSEAFTDRFGNALPIHHSKLLRASVDQLNQVTRTEYDYNTHQVVSIQKPCGGFSQYQSYTGSAYEPLNTYATRVSLRKALQSISDITPALLTQLGSYQGTSAALPQGINLGWKKDEAGNVTYYAFDGNGRKTLEINALNEVTEWKYDSYGMLQQVTEWRQLTTNGNLSIVRTTSYTYSSDGYFNLLSTEITSGSETKTSTNDYTNPDTSSGADPALYKKYNIPSKVTDTELRVTKNEINSKGQITKTTTVIGDPNNNSANDDIDTFFEYTLANTPAVGGGYTLAGLIDKTTDSTGKQTKYKYDNYGNVKEVIENYQDIDIDSLVTYSYNNLNQLEITTDELGRKTKYEYDNLGRNTKIIQNYQEAVEYITTNTYDAAGRLIKTIEPNGKTTDYVYGLKNKVEQIIVDPDGAGGLAALTTSYSYNCLGLLKSETDATGAETGYAYDGLHRLIKTFLPNENGDSYSVPPSTWTLNNATALGATVEYVYDGLGRVIETKNTAAGQTNISATGNLPPVGASSNINIDSNLSIREQIVDLSQSFTDADDPTSDLFYSIQGDVTNDLQTIVESFQVIKNKLHIRYNDSTGSGTLEIRATDKFGRSATSVFVLTRASTNTISVNNGSAPKAVHDASGYDLAYKNLNGEIAIGRYDSATQQFSNQYAIGPANSGGTILEFNFVSSGLVWTESYQQSETFYDENNNSWTETYNYTSTYFLAYNYSSATPTLIEQSSTSLPVFSDAGALPVNAPAGASFLLIATGLRYIYLNASGTILAEYNVSYALEDGLPRNVSIGNDGTINLLHKSVDSVTGATHLKLRKTLFDGSNVGNQAEIVIAPTTTGYGFTSDGGVLVGYSLLESGVWKSYVLKYAPDGTAINSGKFVGNGRLSQLSIQADSNILIVVTSPTTTFASGYQDTIHRYHANLSEVLSSVVIPSDESSYLQVGDTVKRLSDGSILKIVQDDSGSAPMIQQNLYPEQYTAPTGTLHVNSISPGQNVITFVNEILVTFSNALSSWDTTPPAASNFTVERKALGEDDETPVTIDSVQRISQTQFLIKLTFGANDRRDGQYSVTVKPTGGLATLDQNRNGSLDASQTVTDSKFGFYVTAPVTLDPNVTTVSTTMTYDGFDRILSITDPNGLTQSYEYDPSINTATGLFAVTLIAPGLTSSDVSRKTTYYYDQAGRVTKVELPQIDDPRTTSTELVTPTIKYEYDRNSNLTLMTDQLGRQTSYIYDHRDRLKYQIEASPSALDSDDGETDGIIAPSWDGVLTTAGTPPSTAIYTQFWYDAANQLRLVRDTLGRQSYTEYDTLGRVSKQVAPDPDSGLAVTSNTLVNNDGTNITNRLQAGEFINTSVVDLQSGARTTSTTYAFLTSGSDKIGDKIIITQPHPDNPSLTGPTTTYEYDRLGRVTKAILPDPDYAADQFVSPTINYKYNNLGQLELITDPNQYKTRYTYNGRGEVTSVINQGQNTTTTSADPTTTYTYDLLGNVRTMTDSLGRVSQYITDTTGRAHAMINPLGQVSSTLYDAAGRYQGSVDTAGRVSYMTYDNQDRAIELHTPDSIDPLATIISQTRTYDLVGNLTKTVGTAIASPTNPSNTITPETVYRYDNWNRLVAAIRPNPDSGLAINSSGTDVGPKTAYEYDLGSQLVSARTWSEINNANTLREQGYQYDMAGRLVASIAPDPTNGKAWSTTTTTPFTTPVGRVTTTKYDSLDRVVETILPDPDQYETSNGSLAAPRYGYEYDAAGRVIRSVQPNVTTGAVWATDTNGNYTYTNSRRDLASGASTTDYIYDSSGRLTTTLAPTISAVNPNSNTVSTNPTVNSRQRSTAGYDIYGRMTSSTLDSLIVTNANDLTGTPIANIPHQINPITAQITSYTYDKVGNLLSTTTPDQRTSTTVYDALDRATTLIDARDGRTNFTYDVSGNTTSITDAAGNTTRYEFDRRDRTVLDINALGKTRQLQYDNADRLSTRTDRNGRKINYQYDALDRLRRELWANDEFYNLGFSYNAADELTTALVNLYEDGNQFTYDKAGRLIKDNYTTSDYGTDVMGIDPSGAALNTERNWYWSLGGNNVVSEFQYDQLDRRSSFLTYEYNSTGIGNFQDFINTYQYDARSRLTELQQQAQSTAMSSFEQFQPTPKKVSFAYNDLNRWTSIDRKFEYIDENDDPVLATAATSTFQYDVLGRLSQIKHDRVGAKELHSLGSTFNTYDYTYDQRNRLTSIDSIDGLSAFSYDGVGQLLKADHSPVTQVQSVLKDESYQHDLNGNRWSKAIGTTEVTVTSGTNNQLLNDGTYQYSYDDEGNRIRRTKIADGSTTTYEYDFRNRLTAVREWQDATLDLGDETYREQYRYDALDRRTQKWSTKFDSSGNLSEFIRNRYIYDGNDVVIDEQTIYAGGTIPDGLGMTGTDYALLPFYHAVQRYLWAPHDRAGETSLLIAQEVIKSADFENAADLVNTPDEVLWYLADHQNSTRDVVRMVQEEDANNVLQWVGIREEHITYDSYGNVLQSIYDAHGDSSSATVTLTGETGNDLRYLYTGQEFNAATGTYYYNAREYDPQTGKFLQEDPITWAGGLWNITNYVGNDPVNRTDPSGMAVVGAVETAFSDLKRDRGINYFSQPRYEYKSYIDYNERVSEEEYLERIKPIDLEIEDIHNTLNELNKRNTLPTRMSTAFCHSSVTEDKSNQILSLLFRLDALHKRRADAPFVEKLIPTKMFVDGYSDNYKYKFEIDLNGDTPFYSYDKPELLKQPPPGSTIGPNHRHYYTPKANQEAINDELVKLQSQYDALHDYMWDNDRLILRGTDKNFADLKALDQQIRLLGQDPTPYKKMAWAGVNNLANAFVAAKIARSNAGTPNIQSATKQEIVSCGSKDTFGVRPTNGKHYSVITEAKLKDGTFTSPDSNHFRQANRQLHDMMQKDPKLAKKLESMYPGITAHVTPGPRGGMADTPPPGLTWHHDPKIPGNLQLVPFGQHIAPGPIQGSLHPDGKGGRFNWGGGSDNR